MIKVTFTQKEIRENSVLFEEKKQFELAHVFFGEIEVSKETLERSGWEPGQPLVIKYGPNEDRQPIVY